jgi:enoyl-CoA hydratase/carnithine racemase
VIAVQFDDYKDKYKRIKLERDEAGILTVTIHDEGGTLTWGFEVHHELGYLWQDIGADPENKVIVLTAAGDEFIGKEDLTGSSVDASGWVAAHMEAKRLQMALLEIEQPMIAAINGPCTIHAELPLLCDIVLGCPETTIGDIPHYPYGMVPGDGVHVVFPLLMGLNRARYMMLTGQILSAEESRDLGLINEIVPREELLPRAIELARMLLKAPPLTLRLTRPTVLRQVKRQMLEDLSPGLMMEGMASVDYWPPDHGDPGAGL